MDNQIIEAPWTDEQVTALNHYQQDGHGHPFTGKRYPDGTERILIATNLGWIAEEGGPVIQTWAWEFMAKSSNCPPGCDHKWNANCALSCYSQDDIPPREKF